MSTHHCHTRGAYDPREMTIKELASLLLRFDFAQTNGKQIDKAKFTKEKIDLRRYAEQWDLDWTEIVKEARIYAYGK